MSATSTVRLHFRCVGVEERIVAVGKNIWRVTFAPLTAPDGSNNLGGHHESFSITVREPGDARTFAVGDIYEFDMHTAPNNATLVK